MPLPARHILCFAALIGSASAAAESFCVATASQFLSALSSANSSPEDSVINVVQGAYDFTATAGAPALQITGQSGLTIAGGYSSGCGPSFATNPELTLLRVANTGRLLDIQFQAGSSNSVTLTRLGFRQGAATASNTAGCITAESDAGASGTLFLLHTAFRLCSSTAATSALRVVGRGLDLQLKNSVFADNVSTAGAISLSAQSNSVFYLYSNTIAFNARTGSGQNGPAGVQLGTPVAAPGVIWLINNVFYRNGISGDTDVLFNGEVSGFANHNIIGAQNPFPATMIISANSSANPLLVSSTNLRPVAGSPLRNAGNNSAPTGLPAVDADGTPRPQGSAQDIGAYEFSELFADGFEN